MELARNKILPAILFALSMSRVGAVSFSLASDPEQRAHAGQVVLAYKSYVLPFAKSKTVGVGSSKSVPQIFVEQSGYLWDLDGDQLILMVGAISDDASPIKGCDRDPGSPLDDHCEWAAWRSSACYLFVNGTDGHLVGAFRVEPYARQKGFKGRPRCNEVLAVGESKMSPGGMLFTLRFNDSMDEAGAKMQEAGHVETFLFSPIRAGGEIKFVQKSDCLAKAPPASTISRAREFLRSCGEK